MSSTPFQKFLWQFLARKLRRIVDRRLRKSMCIKTIHIDLRSAIIRALAPKFPQKLLKRSTSQTQETVDAYVRLSGYTPIWKQQKFAHHSIWIVKSIEKIIKTVEKLS